MTASLTVSELKVYGPTRPLLSHINLDVPPGSFLSLVGPNGSGKSTLLRSILGWGTLRREGSVLVNGAPVDTLSGRERAGYLAWLPQHSRMDEPLTALELVAAARFRFDERRAVTLERASAALDKAGVAHVAAREVPTLSGGESQRVEMATLLAQEAGILLLDEPANHLDPANQIALYELLGVLWRQGLTVIVVTHDPNLLYHVGEGPQPMRVVGLDDGQTQFDLDLKDPGVPGALSDLFGVRFERVTSDGGERLVVSALEAP